VNVKYLHVPKGSKSNWPIALNYQVFRTAGFFHQAGTRHHLGKSLDVGLFEDDFG
jgi:hypothetical protein